jgi:hypothetical protein
MDTKQVSNSFTTQDASSEAREVLADFVRVPGVLFRWEIAQVLQHATEYFIERAGRLDDVDVYRVYKRQPEPKTQVVDEHVGLEVSLMFPGEPTPIPARLLPIDIGEPLIVVVAVEKSQAESAVLARVRSLLTRPQAPAANTSRVARDAAMAPGARGAR